MNRHSKKIWMLAAAFLAGTAMLHAEEAKPFGQDPRGETDSPAAQGIYSKPVWKKMGRGTFVGGYADFEYRRQEKSKQKLEMIRLVPFLYGDIAPGLRFAAEIEFEHGGATSSGNGDAKIEFAVLDYDLKGELLGLRAGIILSPLGRFNMMHDSPVNDLNERPMVSRSVIPSTFFEPGAGFFGAAYPGSSWKLDYQLYVTQGFNGGANGSGKIRSSDGLRAARSAVNGAGDNNNDLAYSGRLGVSPFLGSEVGFSFHSGAWDNAGAHRLNIFALDWAFRYRFLEFQGEYANAGIERGTDTDPTVPGHMDGFYAQINAHFLEDVVRPGSVFTGVLRWDHQDLDSSDRTSLAQNNSSQRLTPGINYRPIEQAVFKLEYQLNFENYAMKRNRNNTIIIGFATYF